MTPERIMEVLSYDPMTGVFRWLAQLSASVIVGTEAGCINKSGYRVIRVDGRLYYAHRLAWLYMTGKMPPRQIDHRNLIRSDNVFANLRDASGSQNHGNVRAQSNNKIGEKGIHLHSGKFAVQFRHKHIGLFDNIDDAKLAYCVAANKYFGEFARG
jgi:hypothetical protein